jgi:hypothetical protein
MVAVSDRSIIAMIMTLTVTTVVIVMGARRLSTGLPRSLLATTLLPRMDLNLWVIGQVSKGSLMELPME